MGDRRGAVGEGRGPLKPGRPGRDVASQAGARGRDAALSPRPWQVVAVARGPGMGGVEGPGRERDEGATGVTRIRDGGMTPSRRCRELHASSRVVQQSRTRCRLWAPHRGPEVDNAPPAPRSRPENGLPGPESVTFPASSSPIRPRCGISRTRSPRKSDLLPSL